MIGLAVLATLFMVTGRRVVRWEGAALLVGYLAVLPFLA
jgi:Ca2+/Na+ antiporter